MTRVSLLRVTIILAIAVTTNSVGEGSEFRAVNTKQNLRELMQTVHQLAHVDNDPAQAAALFGGTIPNETRLRRALRDNVNEAFVSSVVDFFENMGPLTPEVIQQAIKSGQSNVMVHAATTEEIAEYQQGSDVWEEFPGGAVDVAKYILRPETTFYEVEFLEPGESAGMKFHLFFWDGEGWAMLGPAWRALRKNDEPVPVPVENDAPAEAKEMKAAGIPDDVEE